MILGVLHQKGGVGKTTLSINIASCLSIREQKVLLIDSDPQGSAIDWRNLRESEASFPVISITRPSIHKDINQISSDYDHVVIDGPPRVSSLSKSVMLASDIILIPIVPGPFDLWAIEDVKDLIEETRLFKPDLQVYFVVNKKISQSKLGKGINKSLGHYEYPVLSSFMTHRMDFPSSLAQGLSVIELYPKSSSAKEIHGIVDEVISLYEKLSIKNLIPIS